MATLSELVDAIADVEGIDPATVTLIARYIREAGLISTGGRGPSAAAMGLTDAANLLIGVNATTTAAESARTVAAYRELEAREFSAKSPAMKYEKLGEAIEQLLHAIGVGELRETFLGRGIPPHLQKAFSTGGIQIDLKFRRSGSRLSVILRIALRLPSTISTPATADAWQLVAESGQSVLFAFYAPRSRGPPGKKENTAGDRVVETTIGYRTLSAVGKLLQPHG
jgi:hypothetical protein